jgi:hypothetical protein
MERNIGGMVRHAFDGPCLLGEHAFGDVEAWNTRAAPKVKPLEWEDARDGRWSQSRTGSGFEYLIRDMGEYFLLPFPWKPPERFPTVEAAKAAAQADYERRILEALE